MRKIDSIGNPPTGAAVTAEGVKHVMLSYHYLDIGDIDGYASLLTKDVTLNSPGVASHSGRNAAAQAQAAQADLLSRHELATVVADDRTVVVIGRLVRAVPGALEVAPRELDFADVFTLSEHGLVRSCRRYCYVPPVGKMAATGGQES
ncbi:hypothetical protein M2163_000228 [Streptomyces sp. SAI-135]|uniref:nuclear transport factor 2 family protein n=1 Tax=unclassified Streptomyces TaxID=2593676 RepID=UPI0024772C80|nr:MULTISPECIES: nuclear transport factor 2 family protein [unclassified Streptomyces]MDH6523267.1 hypothetical protein [Streptomyces sp. SAI-090]MDH6574150.1 hypothetical protein [Streptomyces sp. SAI-117]MDH6581113.1 hypothetical protein [Streptomyces sp. SAI-133]MDH6613120.1 hypothetical protein [Streptomyces sp. SAI-135]